MKGWQGWKPEAYRLEGGQNSVDTESDLKPGVARLANNFECTVSGQPRRVHGYERYNGEFAPSAMTYTVLEYDRGQTDPTSIAELRGQTSATQGILVIDHTLISGSFAGGDAVGRIFIRNKGPFPTLSFFTVGETILRWPTLEVIGRVTAEYAGSVAFNTFAVPASYVDTAAHFKSMKRIVEAYWRALIDQVPGSGIVRGVQVYNDNVYAWRDNAGATACVMHKATTAGWSAITLKNELVFTAGSGTPPADGATITQGGVSAVVRRTCLQSGDWGLGTAAGRFIIDNPAGGNFAAGAFTAGVTATAGGIQTAITMAPGGRFECVNYNFYGASDRFRMYGVDGVNRMFEFDSSGDVYAPISTGMATAPDHIEAHRDYLMATYPGGSVQNAGIGNPFAWTIRTGAGEFGLGDDATALKSLRGSVLAVLGTNSGKMLYGKTTADFDLKPWTRYTGAKAYCVVELAGQALAFDQAGAYSVEASEEFGDFKPTMLTRAVNDVVEAKGATAVGVLASRSKGQLRVYFDDRTGITGTFAGHRLVGWIPFTLQHQFRCFASGEINNVERHFAGGDDGYVYELDSGTNFDGSTIASSIRLVASDQGYPQYEKRYHMGIFEVSSAQDLALTLTQEIDVGRNSAQTAQQTVTVPSSTRSARAEFPLEGRGVDQAVTLAHTDDMEPPFTITNGRIYYTLHGLRK